MTAGPVRWIVTNWRLKLLSLTLAIGLLGGVATAENPPTIGSVPVKVLYDMGPGTDVVVVDPTTTVQVPVAGFRNDVERYEQSTAGVTVDLHGARPGKRQVYQARPRLDVAGLTFRQASIPVTLNIESLVTRQLDIEVRAKNKAAGIAVVADRTYATCGNANDHCQVSVTGPDSVVNSLKAYVDYDVPITTASTGSSPNQPIKFEDASRPIDLNRMPQTIPQIKWTPEVVTVLVTTQGGMQTKSVPVSVRVQGTQPCGYAIAGVDPSPNQVTITGPAEAVGKITSAPTEPVSLGGLTTGQRLTRNIVPGPGVTADPPAVTVSVSMYQAFSCAPPAPQPGATVAPTATPTPTPKPSVSPTP